MNKSICRYVLNISQGIRKLAHNEFCLLNIENNMFCCRTQAGHHHTSVLMSPHPATLPGLICHLQSYPTWLVFSSIDDATMVVTAVSVNSTICKIRFVKAKLMQSRTSTLNPLRCIYSYACAADTVRLTLQQIQYLFNSRSGIQLIVTADVNIRNKF